MMVLAIAPAVGLDILTDAMGDLVFGLKVSAAILVVGVAVGLARAALRPAAKPERRNAALQPVQGACGPGLAGTVIALHCPPGSGNQWARLSEELAATHRGSPEGEKNAD